MRDRGYIALLAIVAVVVIIALVVRSNNDRRLGTLIDRADTALLSSLSYRYDSLRFKPVYPPRKSRQLLWLDLNSVDSTSLCKVYGIGAVFSSRIIARRAALGGYCEVGQLCEVRGIDRQVYERIAKNFFVDCALIQKINVNFADREKLKTHPYITTSMADRIIRARMKGGYITHDTELLERNILLPDETRKVAHYLSFDTIVKP